MSVSFWHTGYCFGCSKFRVFKGLFFLHPKGGCLGYLPSNSSSKMLWIMRNFKYPNSSVNCSLSKHAILRGPSHIILQKTDGFQQEENFFRWGDILLFESCRKSKSLGKFPTKKSSPKNHMPWALLPQPACPLVSSRSHSTLRNIAKDRCLKSPLLLWKTWFNPKNWPVGSGGNRMLFLMEVKQKAQNREAWSLCIVPMTKLLEVISWVYCTLFWSFLVHLYKTQQNTWENRPLVVESIKLCLIFLDVGFMRIQPFRGVAEQNSSWDGTNHRTWSRSRDDV